MSFFIAKVFKLLFGVQIKHAENWKKGVSVCFFKVKTVNILRSLKNKKEKNQQTHVSLQSKIIYHKYSHEL